MRNNIPDILLADDDMDDCLLFQEALKDLAIEVALTTVSNGVELMNMLSEISAKLPDALFLDLNMPLKSGLECLNEIKLIEQLRHLPVIIFSTSWDMDVVELLYDNGAHYYIRKPGDFTSFKKVILEAIRLVTQNKAKRPNREQFVIQP